MHENNRTAAIQQYIAEITQQHMSGHAREHAYRPALERLMSSFEDTLAVNDPTRSENGNPDFVFLRRSNKDIILGYAEAKDITVDLDKTLKTEQLRRYAGYEKLFLTNYRDFIFLAGGEEYLRISLAELSGQNILINHEQTLHLASELQAFLDKKPEAIRSGKKLAVIMGGKARRIRDNVIQYLELENESRNIELEKIYNLMKTQLIHDLTKKDFADLYAQTLVYGLFAARYNDKSPDNFDRREAVEAIPKTNPFLRQFFNHIAGADFDPRLRYIVDELCEVFAISDIRALVRHQAKKFAVDDEQDLTIHFYEDFLKEYDSIMRQKMGVYYTPVPVVRYIVRSVDKILKEDFGIVKGLASDETIMHTVNTQPWRKKGERKNRLTKDIEVPRVQILDPAVGTATFLNEIIKHIYKDFKGQEGRWPSYVKENLIKRLHGFELMMAPYTIAHLKLSMTLRETGVDDINERLGVYLTNTLEEGVPAQQDLLSLLGLAGAVSEESQQAADIKTNQPIMVVMGNPPYSVSSNNKSKFIENLVADYKKNLNERNIQPLSDDYIKFIRFAENMISKNGEGIVAMITNNSYIDGLIHRQMRKHLLETFNKIYILDLHGNTKKKEVALDGNKDVNVFDIQQGVGIMLAVKTSEKNPRFAEVHHAELFGPRRVKFDRLSSDILEFKKIDVLAPNYFFLQKDTKIQAEYEKFISIRDLMPVGDVGIGTYRDELVIDTDKLALQSRINDFYSLDPQVFVTKYGVRESKSFSITDRRKSSFFDSEKIVEIQYRPFDMRWLYYSKDVADRLRPKTSAHLLKNNLALCVLRNARDGIEDKIFVVNRLADKSVASSLDNAVTFPLYLYNENDTRTPNLKSDEVKKLLANILTEPSPEDILDYIYAVLHSPSFRAKFKESLKTDFPRVPVPTQADFDRLVPGGRELRKLHLMSTHINYDTTFPLGGDNVVSNVSHIDDKVYINEKQYFGNVPELAWNFYIGGYQPAQKWLKDRKGCQLTHSEVDHYQRIIQILIETDRIMKLIG